MIRPGLALAAALVLATDALVLLGVAGNRSGEPSATVELTERELTLPPMPEQNTGLSLSLDCQDTGPFQSHKFEAGPGWFNQAKLEEIGFDCRLPPTDPEGEARYRNVPPREVFVAMEYEGAPWQAWLNNQEAEIQSATTPEASTKARENLERERRTHTRLFAVDVARDPSLLRKKYPDSRRVIIARGVARLVYERKLEDKSRKYTGPGYLRGSIAEVFPQEIHVPLPHSRVVDGLRRQPSIPYFAQAGAAQPEPRYTVKLAYGNKYEPWIVQCRLTKP